ncbi:MAG: metal ABC transporter ATP-binding protein [Candidatus Binatia bacterium]
MRDLTLAYGDTPVLRDVDLTISRGQFWFFLGPNGTGKTTLLRAILGDLPAARGVLEMHPALRDRAAIGFVPQRSMLNPILPTTVREFVGLGLVGVRLRPDERRARVARALAHAGLTNLERSSYWELSGGQRQRALVARALVREPQLLILDEPTNHLDFLIERGVLDLLAALHAEQGTTVLFVTHALHLARRHATHVALFHGAGIESGEAAVLLRPARLERAYGIALGSEPAP